MHSCPSCSRVIAFDSVFCCLLFRWRGSLYIALFSLCIVLVHLKIILSSLWFHCLLIFPLPASTVFSSLRLSSSKSCCRLMFRAKPSTMVNRPVLPKNRGAWTRVVIFISLYVLLLESLIEWVLILYLYGIKRVDSKMMPSLILSLIAVCFYSPKVLEYWY